MFSSHLTKLRQELATIQVCVRLNSEVRGLRGATTSHSSGSPPCPYEALPCPNRAEWAVYDHCAAVTRLYAIYERFVEDIVTVWLEVVPSLFPEYSELPKSVRGNHVAGVSRVLPKVGEGRYKHLTVDSVLIGLFRSAKGIGGYDLPFELFAITERNLRLAALKELLARVGVDDLVPWLERHFELQEFMTNAYAGQETIDSKLNDLVTYRNEAAHGEDVAQVLGLSDFIQLCEFIGNLCSAVAERIYYCFCRGRLNRGQAIIAGKVTEEFRKADAVVGKLKSCALRAGMEITVLSDSGCGIAVVQSIQLNGIDAQNVSLSSETEVGLKLMPRARVGAELLVFGETRDDFLASDI